MTGEVQLQAGRLDVSFVDGDLRRIRLNGREVLSRIYMALRDPEWNTIPGRITNLQLRQMGSGFSIGYDSVHQQGDIDFRWHATINGGGPGNLSFVMDGQAHSDFRRNRIGLCVHHPMAECAGRACLVEDSRGRQERTEFPRWIAPHQPFQKVAAITHLVEPGVAMRVSFAGDEFETEDQRNWTDASYKTYSTPLALPFPVRVRRGNRVRQRVEAVLQGKPSAGVESGPGGVRVSWPAGQMQAMPALGLALPAGGRWPGEEEMAGLLRLRLSHVRVDATDVERVEAAAGVAARLGAKLEAALTLPGEAGAWRGLRPRVARWLIHGRQEPAAGRETMAAARAVLGDGAVLVAATSGNFAELNRNRPGEEWCDAASFSLNPQVHVRDDFSVMENTAAQGEAVRSAREFFGKAVVVSPVTLRARGLADERQREPFCAAWTVASLKSLAEAGAQSITYFETHGVAGVLEGGRRFPVFGVLEAAGGFAHGCVIPSVCSDWRRVSPLLLADGARRLLLLANLTAEPQHVEGPHERVLQPYGVEAVEWNEG